MREPSRSLRLGLDAFIYFFLGAFSEVLSRAADVLAKALSSVDDPAMLNVMAKAFSCPASFPAASLHFVFGCVRVLLVSQGGRQCRA